ncbi:hypothetical protein DICSQDRAFT_56914 [Dichomitus squalens LYAD-421 SS1]|uniref:uncharacterized protein n=1 Tax=Dichomitus squalens (strain LYAD-421) TaxID=732165 RepID=UPI000441125D|nr:uncharacterized protein DICSQDRAFT_56914 [Dichomitus squalens LYAD-421 SS1]EJF62939.1 hypothetical protein DICSQDRAFT_56914 [Dichomitus squalens LYAD-421 SS1]
MGLATLPVELLDAVLAPLTYNHAALSAVALSCAALNPSATRLLYRHLSLSAYGRNLSLVHLLAARPDLAKHVRTFSAHLDDAQPAILPTYSALQHALRLMTNLNSLALYVDASASWILSPPQAESGQKASGPPSPGPAFYPRLEHLTCNFPLDAHLSSFLAQAPSLISLTLSSVHSDDDAGSEPGHADADAPTPAHPKSPPRHAAIPPSHIPLLEAYTGPAYLLPTLVSRPLKAVHLFGDLTPSLLAAFYTRIAATLSKMPRLSAFELAGMHWQSRPKQSSSPVEPEEKEWISPPVSPRIAAEPEEEEEEEEDDELEDRDYDFDGAFLDWSY